MRQQDFADTSQTVYSSEDEEVDKEQHARMLDTFSRLGQKKRSSHSVRTEATPTASEFHSSAGSKVELGDLVGSFQQTTASSSIRKQLELVQKRTQVLSTPLPKNEQHQIERSVAYSTTKQEMAKWDPVVEKNRKAEQIFFPLSQPNMRLQTTEQFVKRFQPRTPLEVEVAALLHGSDSNLPKGRVLTKAEEKALRAMSLEEARTRRAELQKYRALLSYKEAKARRLKKIKSKKFHRILRKGKLKQEVKDFDELKKSKPEEYLEKLKALEKSRIQERMSLKHKTGSKFLARQKIFGKHDEQSRNQVMEMLERNKELTKKVCLESDDDVNDDSDTAVIEQTDSDDNRAEFSTPVSLENPWMSVSLVSKGKRDNSVKSCVDGSIEKSNTDELVASEVSETRSEQEGNDEDGENIVEHVNDNFEENPDQTEEENLGKFKNIDHIFNSLDKKRKDRAISMKQEQELQRLRAVERSKEKLAKKSKREKPKEMRDSDSNSDSDSELISEGLSRKRGIIDIEDVYDDSSDKNDKPKVRRMKESGNLSDKVDEKNVSSKNITGDSPKSRSVNVDPTKFLTKAVSLEQSECRPAVIVEDYGIDETEMDQRMTIAQAFADDDVVAEFREEKKAVVDRGKPEAIDLTLPGWGDWGGSGISTSKKKRKRFTIKAPKVPQRQDKNLHGVIISTAKDNQLSKHQVNKLPFPFADIKQFESSISAPIGRTWNPETAYRQLIKPTTVTKLGTVIEPIDKAQVFQVSGDVRHKNGRSSQKKGKKKKT